ncbi:hypothetical protein CAEBREN_22711 [Caenorhabditis brenneri]|uniref:Uncharacterized protein n=1 Tax=Caenorhabditis brenneri TaxID=135651 RepID=G0MX05_CAEBE|nr:hypothetical protein CAEBREN_22711 [Caenorhabditis brenneri]
MVERKQGIKYLDGGNQVFYRTNKTWVFDQQRSCKTCLCKDEVAIPNFVFMGLIYLKQTLPMPKPYKFILDIFMIVMKMQPIKRLTVCEVLLDSYKDPVVEFIHTPFFKFLKHALHLKTPDFPDLGFLPKYNKTSDGDFVIMTGKDDIEKTFAITDGINQRPGIGKNEKYEMFQPLTCRKYSLGYSSHEGYTYGIPSVGYSIDEDSYDGVKNIGYRYENLEKALTGHTVNANFRIQFNIPLYSNPDSHLWSNLPTTIVPAMWLDLEVQVQDYALNFFYLVVVVSQRVVFIISIVCLTLSALLTALIVFHIIERKKGSFAKAVEISCNGVVPKHVNHL